MNYKRFIIFQIKNNIKKLPYLLSFVLLFFSIVAGEKLISHEEKSINKIPIAIINDDTGTFSEKVISEINKSQLIEIETEDAYNKLYRGDIDGIFTFKDNFSDSIEKGIYKDIVKYEFSPNSLTAGIISEIFSREITKQMVNQDAAKFLEHEYKERDIEYTEAIKNEIIKDIESYWEKEQTIYVETIESTAEKEYIGEELSLKSSTILFLILVLISITCFSLSYVLLKEKQEYVFEKLKSTNMSPNKYIIINGTIFLIINLLILAFTTILFDVKYATIYLPFIIISCIISMIIVKVLKKTNQIPFCFLLSMFLALANVFL